MADSIHTNPIRMEAAGTAWTGKNKKVRLIQWVDNAGDLVHDSTAVLTINGCALTVKIQPVADSLGFGAVAWQIGPFSPGISVNDFVVTTMATGELHIWHD
jgi:hypothetical protein